MCYSLKEMQELETLIYIALTDWYYTQDTKHLMEISHLNFRLEEMIRHYDE